jgi:hypothetical protein
VRGDLQAVLGDRLLEGLVQEVLDRLAADLLPELLLDHGQRRLAGAEALHRGALGVLLEGQRAGALELLAADGEAHARHAGRGVLDVDLEALSAGIGHDGISPEEGCGGW